MGSRMQTEKNDRPVRSAVPVISPGHVSSGSSNPSENNQRKTNLNLPDEKEWKEKAAKERERVRKAEKAGETKTAPAPDGKKATFRGDKGTFADRKGEMREVRRGSSGYGTLTGVTQHFVMSGHWKNEMLDGFGTFLDSDGSWHEGEWKNGQTNGYGRKIFQDGSTYFGEWLGGYFHGFGRRDWRDGTYYEGEWHANMKHGKGEHVDDQSDRWEGEWRFDKFVDGTVFRDHKRKDDQELWRDGKPVAAEEIGVQCASQ